MSKTYLIHCNACGKITEHRNEPSNLGFMFDGEFRQHFLCNCCNTNNFFGEVAQNLVTKGIPYEIAQKLEKLYWDIHEPFESMTPWEKGMVRASRGEDINYVEAFMEYVPEIITA
jgi:hypothetical protein